MTRLLSLVRDILPARVSKTAARRQLLDMSRDQQRPEPKKIYPEIAKEGAD